VKRVVITSSVVVLEPKNGSDRAGRKSFDPTKHTRVTGTNA